MPLASTRVASTLTPPMPAWLLTASPADGHPTGTGPASPHVQRREIVDDGERSGKVIVAEIDAARDDAGNAGPDGRAQAVAGILECEARRGRQIELGQHFEIGIRRRLLAGYIV